MPSVMNHQFSRVPQAEIQRSSFDRSHALKTTFDEGYLIPIFMDEALPGDTFNLRMSHFARLATPLKPFMDYLFLDSFFFAIPYRLVWDNWQKFNGEQVDPGDSTDFLTPVITTLGDSDITVGSLSDHLGIPPFVPGITFNSFFHRAYNLVWNEWFRDQNLQDSLVVPRGNGPDSLTDFVLKRRGKRHDYFTSCLPWPQKGPDVFLPIGDTAPVVSNGEIPSFTQGTDIRALYMFATAATPTWGVSGSPSVTGPVVFNTSGLEADLSAATASTVNALREAMQLQRLYERDARGGTRYTEILRSHFGVVSPDARLQRPEYLGGGSSPINVHPVAQTGAAVSGSPQANLAAFATSSGSGHGFTKSFTEHCIILGLVSVRADLTYQQGLPRMFSRRTRWDYYWPALSHLGEQAVLNQEIFAQGDNVSPRTDEGVFGYQERHAEYRYKPSLITGLFRSVAPTSLDIWHLSQEFADLPLLNDVFIEENPPISRVVAVPSEPHFLFDAYFNFKAARPMPTFGVPGMMDHF